MRFLRAQMCPQSPSTAIRSVAVHPCVAAMIPAPGGLCSLTHTGEVMDTSASSPGPPTVIRPPAATAKAKHSPGCTSSSARQVSARSSARPCSSTGPALAPLLGGVLRLRLSECWWAAPYGFACVRASESPHFHR